MSDAFFAAVFLVLIWLMGFWGVLNSVVLYMLPNKRAAGEEVEGVVVAGEGFLKKHRSGCLISSASEGVGNNHLPLEAMDCETNGNNPPEIDEDLHSRQLAVYGRETMRRLFASNVLVSGVNGLGAEIGNLNGKPLLFCIFSLLANDFMKILNWIIRFSVLNLDRMLKCLTN